jgi:hypothetical protein
MGLKVSLNWYNKNTEIAEGKEYSPDLGEDGSIIEALGLMDVAQIYDGGFDVLDKWVLKLQPLFTHKIDEDAFDYQISFRYKKVW